MKTFALTAFLFSAQYAYETLKGWGLVRSGIHVQ